MKKEIRYIVEGGPDQSYRRECDDMDRAYELAAVALHIDEADMITYDDDFPSADILCWESEEEADADPVGAYAVHIRREVYVDRPIGINNHWQRG